MPETSTEQKQTDQKITIVQNPAFTVEFFDKQKTTWNRWVEVFENACRISGVPDVGKASYIIQYMGLSSYNILSDKLAPKSHWKPITNKLWTH